MNIVKHLQAQWEQLETTERWLFSSVLGIILISICLFYTYGYYHQAKNDYIKQQRLHQFMQENAVLLTNASAESLKNNGHQSSSAPDGDSVGHVNAIAKKMGVNIDRMDPSETGVIKLTFSLQSFERIAALLNELEASYRLVRASIDKGDREGMVSGFIDIETQ